MQPPRASPSAVPVYELRLYVAGQTRIVGDLSVTERVLVGLDIKQL
jgi:hypothetical protein